MRTVNHGTQPGSVLLEDERFETFGNLFVFQTLSFLLLQVERRTAIQRVSHGFRFTKQEDYFYESL